MTFFQYFPIILHFAEVFVNNPGYMHYNPVRKEFVERPDQWKYSSARNWLLDDHGFIEIQKLNCVHANGAEAPEMCAPGYEARGDQKLNFDVIP
jgi:hypothetical protein